LGMNINRNTLLLFGGAIALLSVTVVLAVSLRRDKMEEETPNNNYEEYNNQTFPGVGENSESQTIGSIIVYNPVAGWRLVENNEAGVSIKVPEDWDISGEISKYDFKAAWNSDDASIAADIYRYDNENKITPTDWARNGGLKQFSPISVSGVSGVRYITKIETHF